MKYYLSEGAVLRQPAPPSAAHLQVYHPGKGWVPYNDILDWLQNSHEITIDEANQWIRQQAADVNAAPPEPLTQEESDGTTQED